MERSYSFGGGSHYPVSMEVRYKVRARMPRVGMGQTSRMSSREIVFTADQTIDEGSKVEISIAWPAMLNQCVPLQLVIEGEVIRQRQSVMTARIQKYHFRTRGPWSHAEKSKPAATAQTAIAAGFSAQEALCSR